ADWLGDFQEDPSKEKDRKKNFEVLSGLIGSNRAYRALMEAFKDQKVDYPHGEHMMFLMYWLNRKTRHASQWMMSLKKGCSWFKNRLIYQGPKGVDDPMASENMDIFSCLQSRDLPCGGRTDSRNYQYGVEAYLQFFSRQLGCPKFPRLSREDLVGIRAKYADSTQALELKPYQPDCCCTQSFQSWWNHYHGRFGAIDIVPDLLLSRPAGGMERRGVGEGSGPAGSKTPIFVQRRRNLVKTRIPVSHVSKVVSPSKANEPETTIPPFPPSGPYFSSPIGPESVSVPIVEVAEEGGEVSGEVPSAEVADEQLLQEGKQQHEDPQVEGCGVANVAEPNSEPPLQAEAVCPLVLEETLPEETLPEEVVPPSEPVCTNEGYHYPAPKADAMPMNEDDAPQSQEAEPKTPVPNPASEPSAGPVNEKGSGTSRSKSFDSAFISKAMTKMLLEKWLALSLEEKVAEEQSVRVFEALDSLHRAHLDFAASLPKHI
ncbi:hypothetical protein Prudu_102S002000, partial [Prunus dulcis]